MRIRKCFLKVLLLIMGICFTVNTVVFGDAIRDNHYWACLKAAQTLEHLGIVDNFSEKWSETDYIKRRDLFDMIYRICRQHDPGGDGISKGTYEDYYNDFCDEFTTPESLYQRILKYRQEEFEFQQKYETDYPLYSSITKEFVDVDRTSDDFIYWYAWVYKGILHGKVDNNGNYYADLDGYATNYEVLKTISCMFNYCARGLALIPEMDNDTVYCLDYFQFAEDIGLINHETRIETGCTTINKEDINEYITAYDCMNLVYYALYIPTYDARYYPTDSNLRLIERYYMDGFTGNRPK